MLAYWRRVSDQNGREWFWWALYAHIGQTAFLVSFRAVKGFFCWDTQIESWFNSIHCFCTDCAWMQFLRLRSPYQLGWNCEIEPGTSGNKPWLSSGHLPRVSVVPGNVIGPSIHVYTPICIKWDFWPSLTSPRRIRSILGQFNFLLSLV